MSWAIVPYGAKEKVVKKVEWIILMLVVAGIFGVFGYALLNLI